MHSWKPKRTNCGRSSAVRGTPVDCKNNYTDSLEKYFLPEKPRKNSAQDPRCELYHRHHVIDFIAIAVYDADERLVMESKKVLLWPVIISIVGHVCLISVSGMIDLRDAVRTTDIITVDIKEMQPTIEPAKKEEVKEKREVKKPKDTKDAKDATAIGSDWREDTVDLGSGDTKYSSYLLKIKRRIQQVWQYPPKAYEKNEEGIVIIKIALDADGHLAQALLLSSSGSLLLDEGTLGVVQTAAPYDQLPTGFQLDRLNVVCKFIYRIRD